MALVSDKGFEGGVFLLSSTGDDFDLFFLELQCGSHYCVRLNQTKNSVRFALEVVDVCRKIG